mmetsp:Transcript_84360/g.149147  ORF Transcript_84360/g.149147 Transcript_84360/m.149147 type:complete len:504 (-) Transcript_84360:267-1778(-)|eukprot:CAMPEP_0197663848 /NCGR_PEP_ID=MMETSP1338-20131121/58274_1 /TAXON_ID=43686 ORGANISM="Pelagodinium beii, Strain RCC1491" /NCGR_SAMPLE_ID=MMETSP1338 /ASSEMBLY_ACC=CAM_ASM_000754 /LENGTH=503 /DNA_ID=CAMNT_0043242357 /DNA_START=42 /DNA_END=1553 /DNA_ORIENTATION=-
MVAFDALFKVLIFALLSPGISWDFHEPRDCDENSDCEEESSTVLLQVKLRLFSSSLGNDTFHPWPEKNHNLQRSGAAGFTATLRLESPAWGLSESLGNDVIYQSPVIDHAGNIYVTSNMGRIVSLRLKDGLQRWSYQLGGPPGPQVPTPALLGDLLFTADSSGNLICLSSEDGHELWRKRYADGDSGNDSWSITVVGQMVLLLGTRKDEVAADGSGARIFAASAVDGQVLWSYKCSSLVFNLMPAVLGHAVIFADSSGTVHSLNLKDGQETWSADFPEGMAISTGGLAIGSNRVAYVTSNIATEKCTPAGSDPTACGDGLLRAMDPLTGRLLWKRRFTQLPANNVPTIFPLGADPTGADRWAVVIGLGPNPLRPFPAEALNAVNSTSAAIPDKVLALDASTGAELWSFDTPSWDSDAAAGSSASRACWPDAFSNAAVDGNGTVYIGWKGGRLFALNGTSGSKLSEYDLGSAINGEPSLAPGAVVAAACNRVLVFLEDGQGKAH